MTAIATHQGGSSKSSGCGDSAPRRLSRQALWPSAEAGIDSRHRSGQRGPSFRGPDHVPLDELSEQGPIEGRAGFDHRHLGTHLLAQFSVAQVRREPLIPDAMTPRGSTKPGRSTAAERAQEERVHGKVKRAVGSCCNARRGDIEAVPWGDIDPSP